MRDIPALTDTWGGFMKQIAILSRSLWQRKIRFVHQAALTALICAVAATASAQPTPAEQQAPKPPAPRESPLPAVAQLGPAREINLDPDTWFRFDAHVQPWFKAAQDRS